MYINVVAQMYLYMQMLIFLESCSMTLTPASQWCPYTVPYNCWLLHDDNWAISICWIKTKRCSRKLKRTLILNYFVTHTLPKGQQWSSTLKFPVLFVQSIQNAHICVTAAWKYTLQPAPGILIWCAWSDKALTQKDQQWQQSYCYIL